MRRTIGGRTKATKRRKEKKRKKSNIYQSKLISLVGTDWNIGGGERKGGSCHARSILSVGDITCGQYYEEIPSCNGRSLRCEWWKAICKYETKPVRAAWVAWGDDGDANLGMGISRVTLSYVEQPRSGELLPGLIGWVI